MKFSATSILALGLSLVGTSHAFVAALYSDDNCQNQIGERNVYDNSCADIGYGFQSWMVTTQGGGGQYGKSYSQNNCASVVPTSCRGVQGPEGTLNDCISLGVGSESNALGSYAINC